MWQFIAVLLILGLIGAVLKSIGAALYIIFIYVVLPIVGNHSLPYTVAGMGGIVGSCKPFRAAAMTVPRYCQADAPRRRQVSMRLARKAKARDPSSERVPWLM